MDFYQGDVLRWLHILAMVYWLGGEWGVFQTSYHVTNPKLPLDERKRHMETAYRIDILARTGILMLFPLGFHMGFLLGAHDLGAWVLPVWLFFAGWITLCWAAFVTRETDRGLMLTKLDEAIRYFFIPAIFILGLWSLLSDSGPFTMKWYAAKVLIFSLMLCIGLALRFIMRHWTTIFRELAKGPNAALQAQLDREIALGRGMAYVYWVGIASIAFLGATKPF
jgi:hypothetical protein